jgi:glutaredoxin
MRIVLYSRRGCHLCERAEDVLLFHRPGSKIVDVDAAADLTARYGLRVPVVEIDGVAVLEGAFDERALLACLASTAGGGSVTGP